MAARSIESCEDAYIAQTGGQFGEKTAFRRSDHPVRSLIRMLRGIFFDVASTPPFQGGEICRPILKPRFSN
jgi:hypothetical protein